MREDLLWRGPLEDAELLDLVESHGGRPEPCEAGLIHLRSSTRSR